MPDERRSSRRRGSGATLGLLWLLGAGWAIAGGTAGPEVTGTLRSIDRGNGTITVRTRSGPQTFKIDGATLSDVQPGQRLRLHYASTGGSRRVSKIEVLNAGGAR